MALIRSWDPFATLARIEDEFDTIVTRNWPRPVGAVLPAVDVTRHEDAATIILELPGLDPEHDLDVSVQQGRLVVSGERRMPMQPDDGAALIQEMRYGKFRREFSVPHALTAADVQATYHAGLLTLRVDLDAAPQAASRVAIRTDTPLTHEPVEHAALSSGPSATAADPAA